MSHKTKVLICGSGSAGLSAAIWLARFGVSFKVLERRDGPLQIGQADGVQCRTVEIFEALGISERLLKEAYHVMELAFWASGQSGFIQRTGVGPDTEPGLTHQPHVILNQARTNEIMIQEVTRLRGNNSDWIDYKCDVQDVKVLSPTSNPENDDPYPCKVTALKDGVACTYEAEYVLMMGDSTDAVWGVMDIYLHTDFPDIRKKAVLNSTAGNILIIPREGDSLVRLYVELPGKVVSEVNLDYLQNRAKLVFQPYIFEVAETAWWSVYKIGQRLADYFTESNRVFLTGDACHTHSPKAGQGMNVSLQDGYNIGWKLGHILTGLAPPHLLDTYVLERQQTATDLINFDRSFTKLFNTSYRQDNGITDEQFREKFVQAGRYTAGLVTKYSASILTQPSLDTDAKLATNLTVGMRLPSALVTRLCDARPMQIVNAVPSDGRWHILVFADGNLASSGWKTLASTSILLEKSIQDLTAETKDLDSIINAALVLHTKREDVDTNEIPALFKPRVGKLKLRSLTKVFIDDPSDKTPGFGELFRLYGINPQLGAIIIVRPDQYMSRISSLGDSKGVHSFFDGCLVRP